MRPHCSSITSPSIILAALALASTAASAVAKSPHSATLVEIPNARWRVHHSLAAASAAELPAWLSDLVCACWLATSAVFTFIVDDLGWANVGYHRASAGLPPTPEVQTPNIDALARGGIQLSRHCERRQRLVVSNLIFLPHCHSIE